MVARCNSGGIFRLLELIDAHPAEFAFDFRSHFHIGFEEIGNSVSYREAILLVTILLRDPDSWLQAAESEWAHPVSREWIINVHTFDMLAAANSKKTPKPYPTPWPSENTKKIGSTTKMSREDVLQSLERMNPKETNG